MSVHFILIYYDVEMITILIFSTADAAYYSLKQHCLQAGMRCVHVADTEQFFLQVESLRPDLVVVSLPLCGYEADQIVSDIRLVSFHTRILALMSHYTVSERMKQFKQGADDIMSLPYHPRECFLRIKRLLQFQRIFTSHDYAIGQGIVYHSSSATLKLFDKSVPVRRREGQVLSCLAEHKNIVVSREQIARWIWGDTSLASLSTVDVYIKRLRRVMNDDGTRIKTVRGLGYQLVFDEESSI